MEKKFKRAERKVENLTIKYPKLLQKDTVRDTVMVAIPSVEHDTTFVPTDGDTVYINKDRLSVQYVRVGDTVHIKGECVSDTIFTPIMVPVETIVIKERGILEQIETYGKKYLFWVIIILSIVIILSVGWKFIKPF